MDAGCRDAGDERVAQGGIEVSALRRPGLRTAPFAIAHPAAAITLTSYELISRQFQELGRAVREEEDE